MPEAGPAAGPEHAELLMQPEPAHLPIVLIGHTGVPADNETYYFATGPKLFVRPALVAMDQVAGLWRAGASVKQCVEYWFR